MKQPYGEEKEYFKHSLFIVLCNRLITCAVAMAILLVIQLSDCMQPVLKYLVTRSFACLS